MEARGWSFPLDTEAVVGRLDAGSFVELVRVTTNDRGFIIVDLTDPYPPGCQPGTVIKFAARLVVDGEFLGDATGPFEAVSVREMRPRSPELMLSQSGGPGCASLTVSGRGFPLNVDVALSIGGADPLAHNFAVIEVVRTDAAGMFTTAPRYFDDLDCPIGHEFGIYATSGAPKAGGDVVEFPRASVVYSAGGPMPAASGNAGPAGGTAPYPVTPLVLATVVLLAVGRTITQGASQ